jgi:EAL domain-containing protein (putative c-di-GMP-specific phosphodiesterase class I)
VEDERTWELLNAIGCDVVQGFILSRPVPAIDLERHLEAIRQLDAPGSPTAL